MIRIVTGELNGGSVESPYVVDDVLAGGALMSGYYYLSGERVVGPVTANALHEAVLMGSIRPTTLVSDSPEGRWVPASRVGGLFEASSQGVPVPPPVREELLRNKHGHQSSSHRTDLTTVSPTVHTSRHHFWESDLGEFLRGVGKWVLSAVFFTIACYFFVGMLFQGAMRENGFVDGGWVDPETSVFVPWDFTEEFNEIMRDPVRAEQLSASVAAERRGVPWPDSSQVYSHTLRRPIRSDDLSRLERMMKAFQASKDDFSRREREQSWFHRE